eukprot:scaffold54599_cov17-Prasinocladus_malaysianus.AAC.1
MCVCDQNTSRLAPDYALTLRQRVPEQGIMNTSKTPIYPDLPGKCSRDYDGYEFSTEFPNSLRHFIAMRLAAAACTTLPSKACRVSHL